MRLKMWKVLALGLGLLAILGCMTGCFPVPEDNYYHDDVIVVDDDCWDCGGGWGWFDYVVPYDAYYADPYYGDPYYADPYYDYGYYGY